MRVKLQRQWIQEKRKNEKICNRNHRKRKANFLYVQKIKINISRAAGEDSETVDSRKAKERKNLQQVSLKKINEFP